MKRTSIQKNTNEQEHSSGVRTAQNYFMRIPTGQFLSDHFRKKALILKNVFVIILAGTFLLFISCSKDDPGNPPEIPPKSSFVIDFSDFEANDEDKSYSVSNDYSHYQRAVAHVVVWNVVIAVHLAVPVASFLHSFNHIPEYNPDSESWMWLYNVNVGANTYTANLFAKVYDDYVRWDMYISKSGAGSFTDFHWYAGRSNFSNTSGEWMLNHSPANPEQFIHIEWNNNIDEGTHDITYTNVVPDGPENGGYISHGFTDDIQYNAFYEIYNKGQDNLVEINWHRTSMEGRIKDPAFFGDDDFRCWDDLLINTECED